MTPAPQEIYDTLADGPIDSSEALHIADRNDLLNPGYLPCERGYCIMPDGTGFIAMLTEMPGVTMDMIEWWFVWHGVEDLRYAIWCPTDHLGIHVKPEDLERRLDTSLSMKERNWNTTDVAPVVVNDEVPIDLVKGLAHHCPREYTNLAAILPPVHAENVHIPDNIEDFR
jgi:hypothetical protein